MIPDNEFSAHSTLNGDMKDMDVMYHHYIKDYETTDYKTWKKKEQEKTEDKK